MEDVAASRRYDPALMHLGLALVAIFTTADFFHTCFIGSS